MLKIAYGEASFDNLRRDGSIYVDKTHFIPIVERNKKFFFIRPRRMGKSLWISVLQAYYDLAKKEQFDILFSGLYIQKNPTELKNSYLVFKLDFSGINTKTEESLRLDFDYRVRRTAEDFLYVYRNIYGDAYKRLETEDKNFTAANVVNFLKGESIRVKERIYVFIDEYDHFANKLAAEGRESFIRTIMAEAGFVREFYEQLKIASGEGVVERFFITGVSPIMLDELSSGFNITSDMSTDSRFNEMIGFTREEVRGLLDKVEIDKFKQKSKEEVLNDLIVLYDGYKFSEGVKERLFNSDMVLYFLERFSATGYPQDLLDENVKTDYNKLRGLIIGASGKEKLQTILEEINLKNTLELSLVKRFNFEQRFSDNELKSLLFYLGLLTFGDGFNQFVIPNQVIRTLYWEYLRRFLEESQSIEFELGPLNKALREMAEVGKTEALKELAIEFFSNKLSNYDYSGLSEKHVKFLFVSYFTLSKIYNIISERELPGRKRIDLLYEAHPAYYEYVKYNFIIEFKYIRKTDSKKEIEDKRKEVISQAKENYEIYKANFKLFGRELRSIAMLVFHSREVEIIEVAGF
ncbi:MAG: AAA family ATPase [Leptospiraceae bacterium]|nr:AAA family ATPase [Leptospiraceae bacterium]MCP5500050.1 AAA family ATPase [Leptospiraceae bacterium]